MLLGVTMKSFKFAIKLLVGMGLLISIAVFPACMNNENPATATEPEGEETMFINPEDNYEGTLKIEESADGKTATISYMLNGEQIS
jgi:hypothetical protein